MFNFLFINLETSFSTKKKRGSNLELVKGHFYNKVNNTKVCFILSKFLSKNHIFID